MTNTSRPRRNVTCQDCGRKLTSTNHCNVDGHPDLCDRCYDAAGLENEHQDGHHEDGPVDDCPMCGTYVPPVQTTGHTNTVAKTRTSHAGHDHPATPKARAACRKATRTATTTVPEVDPTDALVAAVKAHAIDHYDDPEPAAWDVLIETMDDDEIREIIGKARTIKSAVRKLADHLAPYADYRADIVATEF